MDYDGDLNRHLIRKFNLINGFCDLFPKHASGIKGSDSHMVTTPVLPVEVPPGIGASHSWTKTPAFCNTTFKNTS